MRQDMHALAGPYVLGALSAGERRGFDRHLAKCPECAAEQLGFHEAASRLATASAEPPPARMRVTVLAQIGSVRQQRHAAGSHRRQALPRQTASPPRRVRRWRAQGSAESALRDDRAGVGTIEAGPRLGTGRGGTVAVGRPRVVAALAASVVAACLAMAVIAGLSADRAQQRYESALAQERAVAAVLSAGDARTVTGRAIGGGQATVVVSRARGEIVFASAGFPRLPASKTYELWLIGSAGTRPAGLLRPDASGRTAPLVVDRPDDADRVGLTIEPAQGSRQPTTTPLLALSIT